MVETGVREPAAELRTMLARIARRLGLSRPVRIAESLLVDSPAVIGWLRPVVLVPASLASGLTPLQVEAILAHELAHVRRHDYLVNLAQALVETLLFYHPAVWWISARVREEREHCCDDLAVAVCGDGRVYAAALLSLEEHRAPRLAAAATGGALLSRIRRLVVPAPAHAETAPRWIAAVAGLALVLALGGARLLAAAAAPDPLRDPPATLPPIPTAHEMRAPADTDGMGPSEVIRHPTPSAPFAERWEWARAEAKRRGLARYTVGWTVEPPAGVNGFVYVGRLDGGVAGRDIRITGRMTSVGSFDGFHVPGVQLAPLVGGGDGHDVSLLFTFGRELEQVQLASLALPVNLGGRALLWLGAADDAASLAVVRRLHADAPNGELRQDLTAAIGVHRSDELVVPALADILRSRADDDVRSQAVEWLAWHPTPTSLAEVMRAARGDRSVDLRAEAAESLGELALPQAADSLVALARSASEVDVRREAVEAMGERPEPRMVDELARIARDDRSDDVQREAVETLGEVEGGRGVDAVADLLRTHPSTEVRREAAETIGEAAPADRALEALERAAREDRSEDVRREAVETLGELDDARAREALRRIAREHPDLEARREAVETLGESAPGAETVTLLSELARNDRSEEVQREAVETLGEMKDAGGRAAVLEFARSHPSPDIRREAIETAAEILPPDEAATLLGELARAGGDVEAQREAVESLGELKDAGVAATLEEIARTHPSAEVRREAVETLGEAAPTERTARALEEILGASASEEVRHEALETLGELPGGIGVPATIRAVGHPDPDVRSEALQALAESDDPRARAALEKIATRP
jgi:HEAT repeat protein